jgi:hypothetical protein
MRCTSVKLPLKLLVAAGRLWPRTAADCGGEGGGGRQALVPHGKSTASPAWAPLPVPAPSEARGCVCSGAAALRCVGWWVWPSKRGSQPPRHNIRRLPRVISKPHLREVVKQHCRALV